MSGAPQRWSTGFPSRCPPTHSGRQKDLIIAFLSPPAAMMTHVFLEVSVLYKAVLLPVVLPRLHVVDRPLGVGDDAAHVVRLVVRAGVVRPSRVRLQKNNWIQLLGRLRTTIRPLPNSPISFCSTASTSFSGHRGGVRRGSSDFPRDCRGSCDSRRQSSAAVSLCPHRLARRSGIHSGTVPGII